MLLVMGHIGLAHMMHNAAWALSEAEAEGYTKAVAEFGRWHVPSFAAGGKRGSEWGLVITMGMVYLPRLVGGVLQKRASRAGMNGAQPMAGPASEHSPEVVTH